MMSKFIKVRLKTGIEIILRIDNIVEVSNKDNLIGQCNINIMLGPAQLQYSVMHSVSHMVAMLDAVDCTMSESVN